MDRNKSNLFEHDKQIKQTNWKKYNTRTFKVSIEFKNDRKNQETIL